MIAANPPGLPAIGYRSATHGRFLAAMLARLASVPELAALKARNTTDPVIALLDSWATICDVLTFYTERIANEGFLRTATERRSLVEMARLVGHAPKPGAAADTFLAYTLDPDIGRQRIAFIPKGSRANSVPGPGEMPHPFETSANLQARDGWNELKPRLGKPSLVTYEMVHDRTLDKLHFKGVGLNIRPNDRLLFDFDSDKQAVLKVIAVEQDLPKLQTVVRFKPRQSSWNAALFLQGTPPYTALYEMSPALAPQATSQAKYTQSVGSMFGVGQDTGSKIVASHSGYGPAFYQALAGMYYKAAGALLSVQILRVKAPPKDLTLTQGEYFLALDSVYEGIREHSHFCIEYRPSDNQPIKQIVLRVQSADTENPNLPAGATSIRVKHTVLRFAKALPDSSLDVGMMVYAAGEELELADEPVTAHVGDAAIELDGLFDGFEPGRLFIVTGERTDIAGTAGVIGTELVTLASCEHVADPDLPGDKVHTVLHLAAGLRYKYKRDTVKIFGNVVAATAGESRTEVLGGGNATIANQRFPLRGQPLTWLNTPDEPSGIKAAVEIRVDGALWTQVSRLGDLGPKDHGFVLRTDAEGRNTIMLGDGVNGARCTTGPDNVVAVYRTGMGRAGNVKADQITQLGSRPLGVRQVTNPLAAGGGAEADPPEDLRRNIPLHTLALDRQVSLVDYAGLALTRPGIARAVACWLSDRGRRCIHITVAGPEGGAPPPDSPVLPGLVAAYRRFGDSGVPVLVQGCDVMVVVMSAGIQTSPGHSWSTVEAAVRGVLLERFGLRARPVGAPLGLGEVTAAVQNIAGVDYVDIDVFAGVPAQLGAEGLEAAASVLGLPPQERVRARPARREAGVVKPAELTGFSHLVPETVVLKEIK